MRVCLYAPPISRPFLVERLGRMDGLDLVDAASEAEAIATLARAEVFVMPQQFTTPTLATAINGARDLRFLQLLTAGMEKFVGIRPSSSTVVSSGTGGLAPTVAEHAVALLMALARRLPQSMANQRDHNWDGTMKGSMDSLFDKTVAVVGFGTIGQEIARRLAVFGARVIGVSQSGRANPLAADVFPATRLDEALQQSDMVVLSLPSTPATRHVLDSERLSRCRRGVLVVNVGRGNAIESEGLIAALESGHVAGAAVDVTDPEPLPRDSRIWTAPNLIVTPHCAAGGGYARLADYVATNIDRVRRGEEPLYPVAIPASAA